MLSTKPAAKAELAPTPVCATKLVLEPCLEKLRLRMELRSTMDELIGLTVRQTEALRVDPESGIDRVLGRRIADLRCRKDNLLELYKAHVARHSC